MITGYNTDIKHGERVYHVQTEDKGLDNPVLETLVYVSGGQIVASRQYSYASLVKDGRCDERILAELLESQHRQVMRWVAGGKFDPKGPPPFGSTIVSDRSFDEVVLEFIRSLEGAEPLEIAVPRDLRATAGEKLSLSLAVRGSASGTPSAGARVSISLVPSKGKPSKMLTAAAASDGGVTCEIGVPPESAGDLLRVEARSGVQVGSVDIPIVPA